VKAFRRFGRLKDTVKEVDDKGSFVNPERSRLWAIQTPRPSRPRVLRKAYDASYKKKEYGRTMRPSWSAWAAGSE